MPRPQRCYRVVVTPSTCIRNLLAAGVSLAGGAAGYNGVDDEGESEPLTRGN